MPSAIKNLDTIALLGALCLFLSGIDFIIPKPVPFIRIGLANLPVLIGLFILNPKEVIILILLKVLGQALIQGSLFSYIFFFSLTGSLASGIMMLIVKLIFHRHISLIGISILGALTGNMGQVSVAVFFIFGESGWIIAPVVLSIGLVTSTLLGILAQRFIEKSKWIKSLQDEKAVSMGDN
jgi:heptaprenyl diphosphate synthase